LQPVVGQAFRLMNADTPTATIADFGFRISDLTHEVDSQSGTKNSQSAGLGISDAEFQISDSIRTANPASAIANPQWVQLAWQVHAMLVWLAGTLILGIWLFLRLHSLCSRHGHQAAVASLPQSFYNQLADCANRLGLRHIPRVVVTKRLASPAVFGAVRPVLLVPRGYLSKLSRRDTEHMLLHELAHVKRGDLVMHNLYMLLQIAYWYNPLLWLVRRQMHHLRELSCDATVANLLRERTTAYRQTLLETARRLLAASVEPGLGLLGLFEDSNRLLVRLNWLTKPTWRYRTMKRAIVIAIAALMIACVLPMAQARQSASNEVERVTQDEVISVSTENRRRQSEDQPSLDLSALQRHLDQMMVQQQELQNQLRALVERRQEMSSEPQKSQQSQDQLSQDLASLQKHLDELTNQQRDLQEQLRALAGERQERQRNPADGRGAAPRRELAGENIDVTATPREEPGSVNGRGGGRPQGREEVGRAPAARARAEDEVGRVRQEADRAAAEGRRARTEAQRQRERVNQRNVSEQIRQWQQSEQMQQWRKDVEQWQKQVQEWAWAQARQAGRVTPPGDAAEPPVPETMPRMPPMPPIPPMPPMPAPTSTTPASLEEDMDIEVDVDASAPAPESGHTTF